MHIEGAENNKSCLEDGVGTTSAREEKRKGQDPAVYFPMRKLEPYRGSYLHLWSTRQKETSLITNTITNIMINQLLKGSPCGAGMASPVAFPYADISMPNLCLIFASSNNLTYGTH